MHICVIGDFSGNPDEGYKNIAFSISDVLSKYHNITILNVKKVFSISFWKIIKNSRQPQIVHFLTSPSIFSFFILKILASVYWKNKPKTIISAIAPDLSCFSERLIITFGLQPDLVLIQSIDDEKMFNAMGCKTEFLPNGVNLDKFVPVDLKTKEYLRTKYKISNEKIVILHVGHIKEDRNIQLIEKINIKEVQTIVVASKYIKVDINIYKNLQKNSCKIFMEYLKNIEEIYALSDYYFFPVKQNCSILMPLSVLEAMACNLPVITRKYPGLTKFFSEGDGLIFAETDSEIVNKMNQIPSAIKDGIRIKTRDKVAGYSWENIALSLNKIYSSLLCMGEKT